MRHLFLGPGVQATHRALIQKYIQTAKIAAGLQARLVQSIGQRNNWRHALKTAVDNLHPSEAECLELHSSPVFPIEECCLTGVPSGLDRYGNI